MRCSVYLVMKITQLLACLILIFLSLGAARASVFGDVKGTVLDPQQRPIVGAKLTLLATSSAWSQIIQTKSVGDFAFRAVPIGEYKVTVESGGFSTSILELTVLSDRTTVIHLQLKIAPVSQRVEVRDTAGQVNSDSPSPVTLVSRKQIVETPGASRTNRSEERRV